MKIEESKQFIRWCILGAIGGILMAAGDWLLGCVPLQKTDTGMFNRACYLSGAYALWKPALVVGMGALGCFLYSFMVKALNTDIDARYTRTKAIQYFCGLFTVVLRQRPGREVFLQLLLPWLPPIIRALTSKKSKTCFSSLCFPYIISVPDLLT